MRERWEKGSVIGKPRGLTHRVFPAGFRQRFLHLALRTDPIISARCVVAEVEDAQRRKVEDYAELPPEMEKLKGPERLP